MSDQITKTRNLIAVCCVGLAVIVMVLLAVSCASAPTGSDTLLIRAEDVEVNSLALYKAVVVGYHMQNSASETPEVYAALETVRKNFPKAWRSLHKAIPAYKALKNKHDLETVLTEVEGYYVEMKKIWLPHMVNEVP